MNLLLGFAPFLTFAILDRFVGVTIGLVAAAAVALILLVRDRLQGGHAPKLLDIGTTILFGGLAAYTLALAPDWSLWGVRFLVDAGLLLIVAVSMAVGRPFTLQYARESVAPEYWDSPEFLRTNYVISAAWALAFVVLIAVDLVLLFVPSIPQHVGIIATIAALVAAAKFTAAYPERAARQG